MSRRPKPQGPTKAWATMRPAERVHDPVKVQALREVIAEEGGDPADLEAFTASIDLWANDRYVACVERRPDGTVKSISVHRRDRKPIRDWRHMQAIKNDIAGYETEAVELFPADSRLMDTSNEYWLWCLPPGEQFGMGFTERHVSTPEEAARVGARQRAL